MGIEWDLPVGDPAGMRTAAARLVLEATILAGLDAKLAASIEAAIYRGPAGDDLQAWVRSARAALQLRMRQIEALKASVLHEAADLEAAQKAVAAAARAALDGRTCPGAPS
ncbi:MAG: hypothetical protein ABR573_10610 [Candidatus Dormibacteria bacterium]